MFLAEQFVVDVETRFVYTYTEALRIGIPEGRLRAWGDYNEAASEAFVGPKLAGGASTLPMMSRLCDGEGGAVRPRPYKFSLTPHIAGRVEFVEYDAARRVGWGHVVLELYTHERSWPFVLVGDKVEQNLEVVWPDHFGAEVLAETAATAILKAARDLG